MKGRVAENRAARTSRCFLPTFRCFLPTLQGDVCRIRSQNAALARAGRQNAETPSRRAGDGPWSYGVVAQAALVGAAGRTFPTTSRRWPAVRSSTPRSPKCRYAAEVDWIMVPVARRSGSESDSRQPATKRRQILAQLPYDELSSTTLNCVDSLSAHRAKPGSRHLGQAFPAIQPFKILADASIVGLMWEVSLLKIGPRNAGSRCRLIRGRRALTPRTDRRRRCATIDSQDRRAGSDASTA